MTTLKPAVMNIHQAAAYVGRSRQALLNLRHRDRGPKAFKDDGRLYYYVTDLDRWLADRARQGGLCHETGAKAA